MLSGVCLHYEGPTESVHIVSGVSNFAIHTHTTQPFVSKLRREVDAGTMRVGADGRIINTEKIGKSRAVGLGTVWNKASEEERSKWIVEHREELEALLRQMDKGQHR